MDVPVTGVHQNKNRFPRGTTWIRGDELEFRVRV